MHNPRALRPQMISNIRRQEMSGMCVPTQFTQGAWHGQQTKPICEPHPKTNALHTHGFSQGGTVWTKSRETEGGTKQSLITTTEGEINTKQIALLPPSAAEFDKRILAKPDKNLLLSPTCLVGTRIPTRPADLTVDVILTTRLRRKTQIVALVCCVGCNGQRCFSQELLPTH